MATDSIGIVRHQIAERVSEIHKRAERLSPLDIHARMDAIREIAADHGMHALEGLARCSAQLALLPGHRVAMRCCLEHMDEAIESESRSDLTTILAALALRLH